MDLDVDIGTLPISEWKFSVRHIFFRYRNNKCRCRISRTLGSMSMPTYAYFQPLDVQLWSILWKIFGMCCKILATPFAKIPSGHNWPGQFLKSPEFWLFLSRKARTSACFWSGKARGSAGWRICLAFWTLYVIKSRAFSSTTTKSSCFKRFTPGFEKHALAWARKSMSSKFVLLKARTFKVVQNYGGTLWTDYYLLERCPSIEASLFNVRSMYCGCAHYCSS
jgi:hypothetical protein